MGRGTLKEGRGDSQTDRVARAVCRDGGVEGWAHEVWGREKQYLSMQPFDVVADNSHLVLHGANRRWVNTGGQKESPGQTWSGQTGQWRPYVTRREQVVCWEAGVLLARKLKMIVSEGLCLSTHLSGGKRIAEVVEAEDP